MKTIVLTIRNYVTIGIFEGIFKSIGLGKIGITDEGTIECIKYKGIIYSCITIVIYSFYSPTKSIIIGIFEIFVATVIIAYMGMIGAVQR